jgi:hypothetical protein
MSKGSYKISLMDEKRQGSLTHASCVGEILTSGFKGKKQLSVPSTLGISVCLTSASPPPSLLTGTYKALMSNSRS